MLPPLPQPPHRRLKPVWLLALGLAPALAGAAWADPPGFAFLEVPAGARASAMAGAYMSVGEGASSAWWDPAGLASVQRAEIAGSHYEFLQHLRHDQFVLAGPIWGGGTALSLRAMYSEPIVSRDELGNETGSFGSNDLEFMLAHGSSWGGGWRGGGSFQVLHERIDFSSATTWAVNGGLTYDPPARKAMRLALAIQNLGPAGKYGLDDGVKGEPVPLPLALQGGGSYRWGLGGDWRLVGALEGRATRGRNAVGLVGAELGQGHGAAIRAGWRVNDPTLSWTMGVGWTVGGLSLDYAYVPFKLDLGDTHRLSFEARF